MQLNNWQKAFDVVSSWVLKYIIFLCALATLLHPCCVQQEQFMPPALGKSHLTPSYGMDGTEDYKHQRLSFDLRLCLWRCSLEYHRLGACTADIYVPQFRDWGSQIKVPVNSVSGEDPLPGS